MNPTYSPLPGRPGCESERERERDRLLRSESNLSMGFRPVSSPNAVALNLLRLRKMSPGRVPPLGCKRPCHRKAALGSLAFWLWTQVSETSVMAFARQAPENEEHLLQVRGGFEVSRRPCLFVFLCCVLRGLMAAAALPHSYWKRWHRDGAGTARQESSVEEKRFAFFFFFLSLRQQSTAKKT